MAAIALNERAVHIVKLALKNSFPNEKSSHLTEALAFSCGFATHAALRAAIKAVDPAAAEYRLLDDEAFIRRLHALNGDPIPEDEDFDWFESIMELPLASLVVKTRSERWYEFNYLTDRQKAWRNMMVAAINEGIKQRFFSVAPGDNRWQGANHRDSPTEKVFRFSVGEIPALAKAANADNLELKIDVTFWPSALGEEWLGAFPPEFRGGEAFAYGWLELGEGAWLQATSKPGLKCRSSRLKAIAALDVTPLCYADRGNFCR